MDTQKSISDGSAWGVVARRVSTMMAFRLPGGFIMHLVPGWTVGVHVAQE